MLSWISVWKLICGMCVHVNMNIHTVCGHWIFASQADLVMGVMSYIVEDAKRPGAEVYLCHSACS